MSNLIGQQLGQYKIISLLGKGGMATVYRARQESISRDVAVKVIKPDLAGAEMFVARFEREARTVASFSHPHILKVFDYGQFEDTVYLVIELMTGGSLSDLIEQQKSLSVEMTVKMLDQISQALDYAHRRGVIHRDLKPQNVLLDDDQNAFLTDFGIAKVTSSGTGLTQSGIAMGTPSYMPPEQWRGETVDARADIYALGVMLFEMLTGRVPFQGDTPFSMMYKHLNDPPPALGTIRSDISTAVDSVIYRALAKNPEDRYESAAALSAAFKEALKLGNSEDPTDTFLVPSDQEFSSAGKGGSGTPPGTRVAKGTPPGSPRAPKGTPVGLTRAGVTSAGTPRQDETPAEAPPVERRGVPVALIAVGVVIALLVIIGGIVVVTSSSAANQNQTATAVQVALAATTVSNNANGTMTQAAQMSAATQTAIAAATGTAVAQIPPTVVASTQAPITAIAQVQTATPVLGKNDNGTMTENAALTVVSQLSTSSAASATAQSALIGSVTNTPGSTATLAPTQTPSFTPTLTPTLTATFTPTITLTPSSTLTFTPAPPALTGTGICETKTATVNFTIKDVGGPATGTYIVVDSNGFSQDGTLSLLAGESTTLSFRKVYGVVTLIATVNGATQQFTFAAQCGPKPTSTPPPPTATPTITPTPIPPTDVPLIPTTDSGSTSTPVLTQVAALPTNNKPVLAYIARVSGRQGIYTANGDGTNQDALTNTNNSYSPPLTWSPDRSQIAFVLRTNTGESVWIMNADGTNATRYAPTGPGTAAYPAWSPDGQHIAYIGTVNGRSEIYVMNAIDGSEQHAVTNIGLKNTFLAWGSDSLHIFFLSNGVWAATTDGKPITQVNNDTKASSIAVSPNGYKLAVVSGSAIYILDVQNKFAKTPLVDNGSDPSWAPANLRLTYSANGAIYIINVDGTNAKKIADSGTQPEWSPDGKQIAYISGGALFVMGFEGGNPHQIAANAQFPVWAP
jgi:serine/threonine-protein kinase